MSSARCDEVRAHVGAQRDGEALADAAIDFHLDDCAACRRWCQGVDVITRALRVRGVAERGFAAGALAEWDTRVASRGRHGEAVGRWLLAFAALGCLVVGGLLLVGAGGHTHTAITAQREVVILELALAVGLGCAAIRPAVFLPGVAPVLVVVALVSLPLSVTSVVRGNSTVASELVHLPFVVGFVGAAIVRRWGGQTVPLRTRSPLVRVPTSL